jgi:hypothetical protein
MEDVALEVKIADSIDSYEMQQFIFNGVASLGKGLTWRLGPQGSNNPTGETFVTLSVDLASCVSQSRLDPGPVDELVVGILILTAGSGRAEPEGTAGFSLFAGPYPEPGSGLQTRYASCPDGSLQKAGWADYVSIGFRGTAFSDLE